MIRIEIRNKIHIKIQSLIPFVLNSLLVHSLAHADDDGGLISDALHAVPDVLTGVIKQFGKCLGECAFKNMLSGLDEIEKICPSQCATEIINSGKDKIKNEVKDLKDKL